MYVDFNNLTKGHIVIAEHFCAGVSKNRPFIILFDTGSTFREKEYTAVPLFSGIETHIVKENRYECVVNKTDENKLREDGYAKCHQVQTLCQKNIKGFVGKVEDNVLQKIQYIFKTFCKRNNVLL